MTSSNSPPSCLCTTRCLPGASSRTDRDRPVWTPCERGFDAPFLRGWLSARRRSGGAPKRRSTVSHDRMAARSMSLHFQRYVPLPGPPVGGFDHGDVHSVSGRVFVAHTANGTLEVIDGSLLEHIQTVQGCHEGSGV